MPPSRQLPLNGCELVLVRHAESTANASGRAQGRTDPPLSDKGKLQAALLCGGLRQIGRYAALYTSPLQRATQTAEAIATRLGLTPVPAPGWIEIDVGALAGKTVAELRAEHPEAVAAFEAAAASGDHPRNRLLLPGWESPESVVTRAWAAATEIALRHPAQRVLVVTHGGVLNAFLTHLLTGDATETPWAHRAGNCAITHLALAPEGVRVHRLVDDAHLGTMSSRQAPLLSVG